MPRRAPATAGQRGTSVRRRPLVAALGTLPLVETLVVCLVVALLAAAYASLSWYGFDVLEEGYFLANARVVQLGGVPYRDFDTPYTPGVFYLYAWIMDHFGPGLVSLRLLQIAGRAVFFLALYAAGRQLLPPFFAALPPILIFAMDTAPEFWSIHPGWCSAPAAAVAVLAVARYLRTAQARWLFISGVASGVAFAFKQNLAVYGLIAAFWLLAVAERDLPRMSMPQFLVRLRRYRPAAASLAEKEADVAAHRFGQRTDGPPARRALRWVAWTGHVWAVRRALWLAALVLFPLTAAVLVRPYFSSLVVTLFVLPLAALSAVTAALIGGRSRGPGAHHAGEPVRFSSPAQLARYSAFFQDAARQATFDRDSSYFLRLLLVSAGFTLVTLPWLALTIRAVDGHLALLAVIAGKVDPAGYFYGMNPPTLDHARLVGSLLLVPVIVGLLGRTGAWGQRHARVFAGGTAFGGLWLLATVATGALRTAGAAEAIGEPWSVMHLWQTLRAGGEAVLSAWRDSAEGPNPTRDLVLYLTSLAFWPALGHLIWQFYRSRGQLTPARLGAASATRRNLLILWYLASGAALMLNQFPRMDENHWVWSAGVLLISGAVVLYAWYRTMLRHAPALRHSAAGRIALQMSLILLPVAAVLPFAWMRIAGWWSMVPHLPAAGTMAVSAAAYPRPAPLRLRKDGAYVWSEPGLMVATQEVVDVLREKTAPGEPIFAYPAIPGFYYLADRPNATRFNHLFAGMAAPADQEQILQQLEAVRYVVWDAGGAHFWVKPGDNAPVTEYIRTNYRMERIIGPYVVLARDAQGPELPYYLPGHEPV